MMSLGREGEEVVEDEEGRHNRRNGGKVVEEEREGGSVRVVGVHRGPNAYGDNDTPGSPRRTNRSGSRGKGDEEDRDTHMGRDRREVVVAQSVYVGHHGSAGSGEHEHRDESLLGCREGGGKPEGRSHSPSLSAHRVVGKRERGHQRGCCLSLLLI